MPGFEPIIFSHPSHSLVNTPTELFRLQFYILVINKTSNYFQTCLGYEIKQLRPHKEKVAVCFSEIHKKQINTLPGQNVEYFGVEPGGT